MRADDGNKGEISMVYINQSVLLLDCQWPNDSNTYLYMAEYETDPCRIKCETILMWLTLGATWQPLCKAILCQSSLMEV